jgi:hypothetical protein
MDQGYTGDQPTRDAAAPRLQLEVIKLPEAKKGSVLLPRRWVVERSFAWAGRFRRLARAKLTEAGVLEMCRPRRARESCGAIAADFSMSEVAPWKAITGRTWQHLPGAVLKRGGAQSRR